MTSPPPRTRERRRRFGWVRAADDRVPTGWLSAIATALFLAVTAAFGGLATAAEPAQATLQPGDEFRNDAVSVTVHRALLFDELSPARVYADDGQRVLALAVDVENLWTQPLAAGRLAASFSVAGFAEDERPMIRRIADATDVDTLQPQVPTELVVAWVVDADRFADGDELEITFDDLSLRTGTLVTDGQSWDDPTPAATMTLAVSDQGAGQ